MKLKLTFGLNGIERDIYWWGTFEEFPQYVLFNTRKWEWVFWEEDENRLYDYKLTYAEIPPHSPDYDSINPTKLDDLIVDRNYCQCGSDTVKHPGHSEWCKKWRPINAK